MGINSEGEEVSDHRHFVRMIIAKTGWHQTELARRAGLDPSTLSRFLATTTPSASLRASTIQRLEQISGINLSGRNTSPPNDGFADADAVPLPAPEDDYLRQAIALLSNGRGPVDAWILKSRAVELAGYRVDDILLVRLGETALTGDLVCAQVFDWANSRAETVFRIFAPPFLVAASSNPGQFQPHDTNNDKVIIKGVVISTIRQRSTTTGLA